MKTMSPVLLCYQLFWGWRQPPGSKIAGSKSTWLRKSAFWARTRTKTNPTKRNYLFISEFLFNFHPSVLVQYALFWFSEPFSFVFIQRKPRSVCCFVFRWEIKRTANIELWIFSWNFVNLTCLFPRILIFMTKQNELQRNNTNQTKEI